MVFQVWKKSQMLETSHSLSINLDVTLCSGLCWVLWLTEKEFAANFTVTTNVIIVITNNS